MSELTDYKYGILASLRSLPGTFDELIDRDFLSARNHSYKQYMVSVWLTDLQKQNLIYKRGEVYHAYKTRWVDEVLSKYGFND